MSANRKESSKMETSKISDKHEYSQHVHDNQGK